MSQHSEIIAIIPARGGSRGIPRKNIRLLGDAPLVAWSIKAARRCDGIDRVIVSTDDAEIAAISREYGAEVPFLRPPELSRDDSLIGEAETHAIRQLEAAGSLVGGVSDSLSHPSVPHAGHAGQGRGRASGRAPFQDGQAHPRAAGPVRDPGRGRNPAARHPLCFRACALACMYRSYGLISAFARGEVSGRVVFYPVTDPVALVDIDTPADLERARALVAEGGLHA